MPSPNPRSFGIVASCHKARKNTPPGPTRQIWPPHTRRSPAHCPRQPPTPAVRGPAGRLPLRVTRHDRHAPYLARGLAGRRPYKRAPTASLAGWSASSKHPTSVPSQRAINHARRIELAGCLVTAEHVLDVAHFIKTGAIERTFVGLLDNRGQPTMPLGSIGNVLEPVWRRGRGKGGHRADQIQQVRRVAKAACRQDFGILRLAVFQQRWALAPRLARARATCANAMVAVRGVSPGRDGAAAAPWLCVPAVLARRVRRDQSVSPKADPQLGVFVGHRGAPDCRASRSIGAGRCESTKPPRLSPQGGGSMLEANWLDRFTVHLHSIMGGGAPGGWSSPGAAYNGSTGQRARNRRRCLEPAGIAANVLLHSVTD